MKILVYASEGVSQFSLRNTLKSLNDSVGSFYDIQSVKASTLIEAPWESSTALLVFPGGRDLPYIDELHGKGFKKIRTYVANGGNYLGICAGAYFASSKIEFEKGRPEYEILPSNQDRLGLLDVISKGSLFHDYNYEKHHSARILPLLINYKQHDQNNSNTKINTYYNGGPLFFELESSVNNSTFDVLATYEETQIGNSVFCNNLSSSKSAAVISGTHGKGNVILLGTHLEVDPCDEELSEFTSKSLLIQTNEQRLDFLRKLFIKIGLKLNEQKEKTSSCEEERIYVFNKRVITPSIFPLKDVHESTDIGTSAFLSFDYNLFSSFLSASKFINLDQIGWIFIAKSMKSTQVYLFEDLPKMFDCSASNSIPNHTFAIAANQTQGKGRGGNKWISPQGSSLMFSHYFTFNCKKQRSPVHVQYLAALSLISCIFKMFPLLSVSDIKCKWPNDIYGFCKQFKKYVKLGGILTQAASCTSNQLSIVIGMGINLNPPSPALTLNEILFPGSISKERLLAKYIEIMIENLHKYNQRGFESFSKQFESYLIEGCRPGDRVFVKEEGKWFCIHGIDNETGYLIANNESISDSKIYLEPDGNSFDLMASLIKRK